MENVCFQTTLSIKEILYKSLSKLISPAMLNIIETIIRIAASIPKIIPRGVF